jgi:hypothetical protein
MKRNIVKDFKDNNDDGWINEHQKKMTLKQILSELKSSEERRQ